MKTAEDFKRSIGQADPEFEAAMRRTLTALESGKEQKMKKRFIWFAAVAFALLLTGSAYAAANEWRLGDLFNIWKSAPSQTEESNTVFAVTGDTEAMSAVYRVRDAFCDGQKVYIVIEVKPRSEYNLIVPQSQFTVHDVLEDGSLEKRELLSLPLDHWSLSWLDVGEKSSRTLGEYLHEKKKFLTPCNLSVYIEDDQGNLGLPMHALGWRENMRTLEDGTLLYMEAVPWKTEEKEVRVTVTGTLNMNGFTQNQVEQEENNFRVTIPVQPLAVTAARGAENAAFDKYGMQASVLSAQLTDLGLEVRLCWTWDMESNDAVYQEMWGIGVCSPASDNVEVTAPYGKAHENQQEQLAYFIEVTKMPESLTLFYAGEKREVKLIPAEPEEVPDENEMDWFTPPAVSKSRLVFPIRFTRNDMRVKSVTARQTGYDFMRITVSWDWDNSEHKYVQFNPAPMGVRLPQNAEWKDRTLQYGEAHESNYDMIYDFPLSDEMPDTVFIRYGEEETEVKLYPVDPIVEK